MAARWTARQFHNQPEQSHSHGFLRDLWEEVAARSAGELVVSVHAQNAGIPGSDPQALQMLVSGELEFTALMGGILGTVVPAAEIQGMPFAFSSHAQVHSAMRGPLGDYVRSEMAAKGIHGFRDGVLENGFRHIVSIDRPVRSPGDLAGYRMRVPAGRVFDDLFRTLGAQPVLVNIRELPEALRSKAVDGHENPLVITEVNRLYEPCRYVSLTGHMWSGFNLIANRKFWLGLPEPVREIVESAVRAHAQRQRAYTERENRALEQRLAERHGMIVNVADAAAFRHVLLTGFYGRWRGQFGARAWDLLEGAAGKLA